MKTALEVGLGFSLDPMHLASFFPTPMLTLLKTRLCRTLFENLARSPQKSLPLKLSLVVLAVICIQELKWK